MVLAEIENTENRKSFIQAIKLFNVSILKAYLQNYIFICFENRFIYAS